MPTRRTCPRDWTETTVRSRLRRQPAVRRDAHIRRAAWRSQSRRRLSMTDFSSRTRLHFDCGRVVRQLWRISVCSGGSARTGFAFESFCVVEPRGFEGLDFPIESSAAIEELAQTVLRCVGVNIRRLQGRLDLGAFAREAFE